MRSNSRPFARSLFQALIEGCLPRGVEMEMFENTQNKSPRSATQTHILSILFFDIYLVRVLALCWVCGLGEEFICGSTSP